MLIEGNPGRRPINRREPKPREFRHLIPRDLDEVAQKEWKRLVLILKWMRVLTEADYMALTNLCQAASTQAKAQEQLSKSGLLLKTSSGYVHHSPLISIINAQTEIILKHLREFGLTPDSRSRLQMAGERQNDADELLNGNWGS